MNTSRSHHILIVDDEPDLREIVISLLSRPDLTFQEAGSGNEALQILRSTPFDIVISDVRMPDGDGLELLKEIPRLPSPPALILMSGYSDLTAEEALARGARAFLDKPFDIHILRALVQDILYDIR